jgi:hypothetical protein
MTKKISLLLASALTCATAANLTADDIMARVAENQDRSLEARKHWTYRQTVLTRLSRTNGKLAREEDKVHRCSDPEGIRQGARPLPW